MISKNRKARWVVYGIVAALVVLHQDFWFWRDRTLVFGFMPIGLAYHAAFSIVSAVAWAVVMKYAWPAHIEQFADGADLEIGGKAAAGVGAKVGSKNKNKKGGAK